MAKKVVQNTGVTVKMSSDSKPVVHSASVAALLDATS
jgi:hypothetical protein